MPTEFNFNRGDYLHDYLQNHVCAIGGKVQGTERPVLGASGAVVCRVTAEAGVAEAEQRG